jgi:hypothetical protein
MSGKTLFVIAWFIVVAYLVFILYKRGKKAISIFPPIDSVKIKYRDKSASGFSSQSFKTRIGGSNKLLDIVVTDKELWLKSKLLFASIGQRNDLLHKISLDKIEQVVREGNKVIVNFRTDSGEEKQVVLMTKGIDDFIKALNL